MIDDPARAHPTKSTDEARQHVARADSAGPSLAQADEARQRLAVAEGRLLAALVAGGPEPPGFDGVRLKIQSHSLIAKRRGLVATVLPSLVSALGKEFTQEFFAYANGRPKPPGGSRADAQAFVEWLHTEGRLPDQSPSADSTEAAKPTVSAQIAVGWDTAQPTSPWWSRWRKRGQSN